MKHCFKILGPVIFLCLVLSACCVSHQWEEATCTEPKTCSKCGKTEGEPLGHTPGDWEMGEPDYVTAEVKQTCSCVTCGAEIDSKVDHQLIKLHENGKFLFTVDEFTKRLGNIYHIQEGCSFKTELVQLDNIVACGITDGTSNIGAIGFIGDGNVIGIEDKETRNIDSLMATFFSNAAGSNMICAIDGIIAACDPSLDSVDVRLISGELTLIVTSKFVDIPTKGDFYEKNGITYGRTIADKKDVLMVTLN